jgi:hypothetical protein
MNRSVQRFSVSNFLLLSLSLSVERRGEGGHDAETIKTNGSKNRRRRRRRRNCYYRVLFITI